jgi:hypothetical protein
MEPTVRAGLIYFHQPRIRDNYTKSQTTCRMNYRAASRAVSEQRQLAGMNLFVVLFLTLLLHIATKLFFSSILPNSANVVAV